MWLFSFTCGKWHIFFSDDKLLLSFWDNPKWIILFSLFLYKTLDFYLFLYVD